VSFIVYYGGRSIKDLQIFFVLSTVALSSSQQDRCGFGMVMSCKGFVVVHVVHVLQQHSSGSH
jgi:hypothetical protein